MKDNTRCVPVAKSDKYPEGLVKFDVCFDCPCYDDNIDECNVLDICIDIPDAYHSIHNDCPLFLYDRMRWHSSDDKPEGFKRITVKFSNSVSNAVYIERVVGFYNPEVGVWVIDSNGSFSDDWIDTWKYLDGEVNDGE